MNKKTKDNILCITCLVVFTLGYAIGYVDCLLEWKYYWVIVGAVSYTIGWSVAKVGKKLYGGKK